MDKLSKGKSNFETMLASQNWVFGKSDLGFNPQSKNSDCLKHFSTITENQPIKKSKQPVVCCFYCMRKGHFMRFCKVRKILVPRGLLKWVPKVVTNIIGTKFIRGPNLAF